MRNTSAWLKRLMIGVIVAICAFLTHWNVYAEYQTIYKAPVESMTLAPGVVFEKHRILTSEGWIDAQVIRSSAPHAQTLVPIYPTELYRRTVLSKMFDDNPERLVAAINTDFSDYNSYAALGQTLKFGELIQTSNGMKEMAHVRISRNGTVDFGYNPVMTHIGTVGSEDFRIDFVNKEYYDNDRILLFDYRYAKASPEATDIAVHIRGDVVVGVKEKGGVFSLEKGDLVLHCTGKDSKRLKEAAKVGARFRLKIDSALRGVYHSFSGGSIIVKDGKPADFTHNILGHHPRTAMGVSKDGETVVLVTISGRSISYRGMRQSELAEFMIQLGAYQAINLDGGGSTEMIYRDPYTNNKVIPGYLSDGGERRLYNGLGVVYDGKPTGEIGGIRFATTEVPALIGIPIELKLQAYDTAYLPYSLENSASVSYEVKGIKGRFVDNTFVPESEGSGTIIASVGDKRAYMNVEVERNPVRLQVIQNDMAFRFALLTETGAEIPIPPSKISAFISDAFGTYDANTGVITPAGEGRVGYVTFTYYISDKDILSESLPLSSGMKRTLLYDFSEGKASLKLLPWNLSASYRETPVDDANNSVGFLSFDLDYQKLVKDSKDKSENKQISKTRAAYIDLGGIALSEDTEMISLRVFGSKADNAWMRLMLKTEDETPVYLDIARNVNWSGWKTLEVVLPKMSGKRYLERVYVVEVDENVNPFGYLLVDHIEAIAPVRYEGFMPLSFTMEKKVEDYQISGAPGVEVSYLKAEDLTEAQIEELEKDEDGKISIESLKNKMTELEAERQKPLEDMFTFLTVKNENGLIRSDEKGWQSILDATRMPKKPILIRFTGKRVFKDNLEWELLNEKLRFSGKEAVLVFDAQPGIGNVEYLDSKENPTAKKDEILKSVVSMRKGITIIELSADEEIEVNAKCEFVIRKKK